MAKVKLGRKNTHHCRNTEFCPERRGPLKDSQQGYRNCRVVVALWMCAKGTEVGQNKAVSSVKTLGVNEKS